VGLRGADLSYARLDGVHGDKTSLDGADLSGARAANLTCRSCRFAGADLRRFLGAKATLFGSSFERAVLSRADLTAADLRRTALLGADLTQARLDGAHLEYAVLTGVVAGGASLRDANLQNADLRGADLSGADLSGANLALARVDCGTRFPAGFDASKTSFVPMASCPGWRPLHGAGVDISQFPGVNLDGARLTNLVGAQFFKRVSARGASLDFAKESALHLKQSDLTGATVKGPEGVAFDAYVWRFNDRLDGALFRDVKIRVRYGEGWIDEGAPPREDFPTTIVGLRLERATIDCTAKKPDVGQVVGEPVETRERRRRASVSAYIEDLAFARRLAALGPSCQLSDACGKAVELYFGGGCKAGFADAGFEYACPAAP
jgi:uncharacterized protein YjbI with pentapeptide repeats